MFWRTNETDSAGRPSLHGRLVRLDARRDDPIGAASQGGLVCLMLEAGGLDDRNMAGISETCFAVAAILAQV